MTGSDACRAFGAALRAQRRRAGMTQAEFAERCGLYRGHMSDIETGRCNVSLDTIMRLLPALDMSFGELAGEVDKRAGNDD